MQTTHPNKPIQTLSRRLKSRRALNEICAKAVQKQIESGQAEATHLRNRRRHLAKQILKRIPHASRLSPKKILHTAMMILAMWGLAGMSMPQQASAAPMFKHTTLAGFDVGFLATPTFADIDGDGDLDAFVGEKYGTVKFYRNIGTAGAPNFVADAVGNPLAGVAVGRDAAPTFADIDGDGDLDAFVGEKYGTVKFYRNIGTAGAPNFVADAAGNPLAGFDVGTFAKPTFADIDNDGDLDAFVGGFNGTVKFYRNTQIDAVAPGTGFVADAAANPLAGFNVGAAPTFADIDGDGDLDAFVGEKYGTVKFYRNTQFDAVAPGTGFVADAAANPLAGFNVGGFAAPTFADIDGDGDLDAFVGQFNGTVKFYRNNGSSTAPNFAADAAGNPLAGFDVGYDSAPAFADIDGDGDLDAFVGEYNGTVKFYRNNGSSTAPNFAADAAGNPLAGFNVLGGRAAPTFADIDGDGDLDAFVGTDIGTVKFYRNTQYDAVAPGTGFVADAAANPLAGVFVGGRAAPTFVDIDGDGDLDAFVGVGGYGSSSGTVKFYRNTQFDTVAPGTGFVADLANPLAVFDVGFRAHPTFADIDGDGDLDAFVGEIGGTVKFYRNNDVSGNGTAPVFVADAAGNPLAGFNVGHDAIPTFADIDGDGDLDAFVGEVNGTVKFFRNFDPSPVTVADSLTATSGLPAITADVTANDQFKPEGPATNFTINSFTQGANGAVVQVAGTNTFTYTSNAGFTGVDSFTYTLDDGVGNTSIGMVNVTVNAAPLNNPPAPTAPAIITNEDTPATSQVAHNDPDVGDTQAYAVTTAAANGVASVDAMGLTTYTPNLNFNGADSFVVTVTDAAGAMGAVTINVTVNAVNDAPVPSAPSITTNEDTPAISQVAHNDPDLPDTHTYAVTTVSINGTASVDAAGLATYTPNANFNGTDSFTVAVTDAAGATGNVTINVTVNAVNDAPVPSAPAITTSKATPGTSQVFPNDPDVGDTHTYAVTTGAANGTATVDAAGLATYTPNTGFAGNDSFTVTVTDAAGATGTVTINVTVNVPAVSTVGLSLNGSTFNSTTNKVMMLNATMVASNPPTVADVYVALQLPDGTLLFMQPGGGFGTTLTPLLSNVPVPDFNGPIFNFTFSGLEPAGTYTWFAALTVPGSLNIIGTLATAPFSFAP